MKYVIYKEALYREIFSNYINKVLVDCETDRVIILYDDTKVIETDEADIKNRILENNKKIDKLRKRLEDFKSDNNLDEELAKIRQEINKLHDKMDFENSDMKYEFKAIDQLKELMSKYFKTKEEGIGLVYKMIKIDLTYYITLGLELERWLWLINENESR